MSEISDDLSVPQEAYPRAEADSVPELSVGEGVSGANAGLDLQPTSQGGEHFGELDDTSDAVIAAREQVDDALGDQDLINPTDRTGDKDADSEGELDAVVAQISEDDIDDAPDTGDDDGDPPEPPDDVTPPGADEPGPNEEWDNPRGARLVAPVRALEGLSERMTDPTEKDFVTANTAALHEAAAAGVEVIDSTDVSDDVVESATAQPEVYNVVPSRAFTVVNERAMAQELAAQGDIAVPTSKRFLDTTFEELRDRVWEQGPFVLARTDLELGQGKYLIDDRRQVDTLGRLMEVEENHELLRDLVVTDFVPTPSDHYTSYKAISTPNGNLLAASLLYSPHEKDEYDHRLVTIDDPSETDDILRILFEYPESNAFLGAKLIGSYAGEGSEEIALMGPYAGQLRPGEAEILEAHGIDPSHPAVPEGIARQVTNLRPIARLAGLASSEDFIQSAETGDHLYLETNSGPGPNTYAICWLGDPAHPDGFKAMYRAAAQRLIKG